MKTFNITNLFPEDHKFQQGHIETDEFEKALRDTVAQEHPLDPIKTFDYTEEGVEITLESGEVIEVQVDWQEFILS
jgi:hypothetical protein